MHRAWLLLVVMAVPRMQQSILSGDDDGGTNA